MQNNTTHYKDLILIGGGHSHALVLKMWAMQPLAGVRLTLISPATMTPYSGMLPGLIAGNYLFEETHIDLARLCQYANARYIQSAVTGIDLVSKTIMFADRPALGFDLVSINTGITPLLGTPGADQFAIAVKPIANLYSRWQQLVTKLEQLPRQSQPFHLAVVGGGAAGVELIFAFQHAIENNPKITTEIKLHLLHKGARVPEGYPRSLQKVVSEKMQHFNIQLHCDSNVEAVRQNSLIIEGKADLHADALFWCTQAGAPEWIKNGDLELDQQGFIAVNEFLQSTSHEFVFACGDIATQVDTPRPRAGVFAVRQAPTLFHNLRRALLQKPLKPFRPQRSFLSLLVCGGRWAVGYKALPFFPILTGHWVWKLKKRIDQKFMSMFHDLSPLGEMSSNQVDNVISNASQNGAALQETMRCGGCGAKVGSTVLQRVMKQLTPVSNDDIVIGLHNPDDAAVIRIPEKLLLVQSVDVFRALLSDPYLQGKIAAEHALSDVFAMNATPHSALAIVTLPYAAEALVERDLFQLMSGALSVLNQHHCALIGGHTSEGAEMSIGFSVNATATEATVTQKASPKPGHVLILTQPLGTGALFAAHNQLKAKGIWIEEAIHWMTRSNQAAATILSEHRISACTDVTGFGLLGHLLEMLKPHRLQAEVQLSSLPALSGAVNLLQQGITSSLHPDNLRLQRSINRADEWVNNPQYPLLFDPQTSGGLLACIPREEASECLQKLQRAGYEYAAEIGEVVAAGENHVETMITLKD